MRASSEATPLPRAWLRSRVPMIVSLTLLVVVAAWTARHFHAVAGQFGIDTGRFAVLWSLIFGSLAVHLGLAWMNKPAVPSEERELELDALKVVVVIPAYNEDPAALKLALRSLFLQTRLPAVVHVVDDGSTASLDDARRELARLQLSYPMVETRWTRTVNQGKRHAQIVVFEASPDADVYATMDSDTILDAHCLENAMHGFTDPRVTSVAALTLAYNNRNWFVRITDAWLLSFQLVTRAALSKVGNVLVNSGGFALYRADVVRDALPSYRSETFMGNVVMFSDDSLLTLFARLKGRTVQQDNAVSFTIYPERVSHHLRQQLRWMRGSTIRSLWRFRYLPVRSLGYWENFANWVTYVLITVVFIAILVVLPLVTGAFDPMILVLSAAIAYMVAVRYLVVGRSDQSLLFQCVTVAVAPLMLIWTMLVLRPLRMYAIATCGRTGWGTRSEVEVAV